MKTKVILILAVFLFQINSANAQYSKLWDFGGISVDGNEPTCDLVTDGVYLYGTTRTGGSEIKGIIFRIKPDGTDYTKLYDFVDSGLNGQSPTGSLFLDNNELYGMTQMGGINSCGVIYKINTDGSGFLKLFDFYPSIGKQPSGSVISDGVFLYGMTELGGTNNLGVAFKIQKDGSNYTKLFDFSTSFGSHPSGSFLLDGMFLYGATPSNGSAGGGTIFKIKTDGTAFQKLIDMYNKIIV